LAQPAASATSVWVEVCRARAVFLPRQEAAARSSEPVEASAREDSCEPRVALARAGSEARRAPVREAVQARPVVQEARVAQQVVRARVAEEAAAARVAWAQAEPEQALAPEEPREARVESAVRVVPEAPIPPALAKT